MKSLDLNSLASFSLFNAQGAITINSSGDIVVQKPTEIRFVLASNSSAEYKIVGISFNQTDLDRSDPVGSTSFPIRSISDNVLIVRCTGDKPSTFKYSVVFQRKSDGTLAVIDPRIKNGGIH